MTNRLDELKDLRDYVRKTGGVATSIDLSELDDLLAVVEAARILVENQKGGKMNPLAWDSLDKALAKLDEEDKNV